jgi:hypothetical protein
MVHRVPEGVTERAEHRPHVPGAVMVVTRACWLLARSDVLGLFLAHRSGWPGLALPVLVVVPPFLASGDREAAMAGRAAAQTG